MNNSIYESIILSKSNIQIPLFKSGRSVDSRYFPEKEAEKIIAEISNSYKIFFSFWNWKWHSNKKIKRKISRCKNLSYGKKRM
jgi:hypothetical protein